MHLKSYKMGQLVTDHFILIIEFIQLSINICIKCIMCNQAMQVQACRFLIGNRVVHDIRLVNIHCTTQQKNLDNIVFTPFITTPTQLQKATSTHIPSYIKNGLIGHPLTKKHLWSTSDRANLKIVCTLLQIYFIMRGGDEDEGRVSAWEW